MRLRDKKEMKVDLRVLEVRRPTFGVSIVSHTRGSLHRIHRPRSVCQLCTALK